MGAYSKFNEPTNYLFMHEMSEEAILEAYFGTSKELEAIIRQLGVFRSKYTDRFKYGMYLDDVNIDPELLKFNRMMEDFFGFGTFSLIVDPGVVQNAFTFPIGQRIDTNTKKDIRADKTGFKYDKSAGYTCVTYIYTGLIFSDELTDREVMAIILHEVGHNFSGVMDHMVTFGEVIQKILFIPRIIIGILTATLGLNPVMGGRIVATTFNSTAEGYVKFMEEARKNNSAIAFLTTISKAIGAIVSDIDANISAVTTPLMLAIPGVGLQIIFKKITRQDPLNILMLMSGYQNEKISDNFATMYGLGPDLTSAFKKMDDMEHNIDVKRAVRQTPLLGHIHDLIMIPFMAVWSIFDPHPAGPQRLRNQLMVLKAEVDKEKIDPKLKKAIQEDIDAIEKQIQDMKDEFDMVDGKAFSKLYGFILYNVFKGDFREMFANPEKDVKKYDQAYERALAKSEKK